MEGHLRYTEGRLHAFLQFVPTTCINSSGFLSSVKLPRFGSRIVLKSKPDLSMAGGGGTQFICFSNWVYTTLFFSNLYLRFVFFPQWLMINFSVAIGASFINVIMVSKTEKNLYKSLN